MQEMIIDRVRQSELIDLSYIRDKNVLVIGAGGIGASVVLNLAKVGFRNITVYDNDILENHNIPNQFLPLYDRATGEDFLGTQKVHALAYLVQEMTGVRISTEPYLFPDEHVEDKYQLVISAVDSMASRKAIWDWTLNSMKVECLIDGRMGYETMQIYTVDVNSYSEANDTIRKYESTLFSDEEAEEIPCTQRATIYLSSIIGGLITRQAVKVFDKTYRNRVPYRIIFNLKAVGLHVL